MDYLSNLPVTSIQLSHDSLASTLIIPRTFEHSLASRLSVVELLEIEISNQVHGTSYESNEGMKESSGSPHRKRRRNGNENMNVCMTMSLLPIVRVI